MTKRTYILIVALVLFIGLASFSPATAQNSKPKESQGEILPTGMSITPTMAKGSVFQPLTTDLPGFPKYAADHPVSTAVSPDGNTLLILTSGFNRNFDATGKSVPEQSREYVFVYDIRRQPPVKKQVLTIANAFAGLAWSPDGAQFYVSGGSEDVIHVFTQTNGQWAETAKPISLGHASSLGVKTKPIVAGLAVNASGTLLAAANYENDSVSLVDLKTLKKTAEVDLRPGKNDPKQRGVAGGAFPFWIAFKGDDKAYVSSLRDREIVVLDLSSTPTPSVSARIKVQGQPNKLLLNKNQGQLFAACDNSDSVVVINTSTNQITANISTTAPEQIFPNKERFRGSNPNSIALSPDEHTLYVTNGGTNSVSVVRLADTVGESRVQGMIPTGWSPQSVSLNRDGSMLYIVNGKSNSGPNPKGCRDSLSITERGPCVAARQYVLQLIKGGFLAVPRPDDAELQRLTRQVASNNHFLHAAAVDPVFSFLHSNVKHVIYIVKENRTYDQVLGDLEKGNGDPAIALFKEPITPNHHDLARRFVTLDNFYDSGDVSGNGWNWSTAARVTDVVEKTVPLSYAGRGFTYDFEGVNRGINVSVGSPEERAALDPRAANLEDAADQLPGTGDVAAPDGPEDSVGAGYLWDSALNAGLKVRNYGFFLDLDRYSAPEKSNATVPLLHDPAATTTRVAFPSNPRLHEVTDPYFRGFDQKFADYWRFKEWEREFDEYVKNDNLPSLELVRFCHDHFGDFKNGADGINTVETEMADNDYALGLLVEKIAKSKYAKDTLIFVIEDDAQNGPDHVDAHRSIAFVVGPYVKQGAVVSRRYNTVSMLRTIEEILGIKPLGLNDAVQSPMEDVFSNAQAQWSYAPRVPAVLRSTQLPLPAESSSSGAAAMAAPSHNADYWARATKGFDFSAEDKLDSAKFNLVLWKGMMGNKPYPTTRSKLNLRLNRTQLLKREDSPRRNGDAEKSQAKPF